MNWDVPLFFVVLTALFYFYIQYGNSEVAIYEWPVGIKLATSVAVVFLFYLSLLSHGLLRASTASVRGYKVKDVTIFGLGVTNNFNRNITNFKHVFWMTLAGPMANLLIIALLIPAAVASIDNLTLSLIFAHVFYINIAIMVLSLILRVPIYGGLALRKIIWSVSRDRYLSSNIPVRVGQIFGISLILPLLLLASAMAIWRIVNPSLIDSNLVIHNFFVVVGAYVNPLISLTGSLLGAMAILIAIQVFGFYVLNRVAMHNRTLKRSPIGPTDSKFTQAFNVIATIGQFLGMMLYATVLVWFWMWLTANTYNSWAPEITNFLTESRVVLFASITSGLISLIGVYVFYKATVYKLNLRRSETDQRESQRSRSERQLQPPTSPHI